MTKITCPNRQLKGQQKYMRLKNQIFVYRRVEKHIREEKMLVTSIFYFFNNVLEAPTPSDKVFKSRDYFVYGKLISTQADSKIKRLGWVIHKEKKILKKNYNHFFHLPGLTLSQTTNFRLLQTERVCRRQFQI